MNVKGWDEQLWMCPLVEVKPDYNFLMGYHTGVPKEWYCGIEGVTSIFMGAWNDPMIGYKGYAFNEPMYTDGLYEECCDDIGDKRAEYEFSVWLKEHSDYLFSNLEEAIDAYENFHEIRKTERSA